MSSCPPSLASPTTEHYSSAFRYVRARARTTEWDIQLSGWIRAIKDGSPGRGPSSRLSIMGRLIATTRRGAILRQVLDGKAVLVPVPRSSITRPGTYWPALEICKALVAHRLARSVEQLLSRTQAIAKSSGQTRASNRPSPADHYRTISVTKTLLGLDGPVVLVDDVITRGSTLLGCAVLLRDTFPDLEVRLFALARTTSGGMADIADWFDPVLGSVAYFPPNSLNRNP